MQSEVDRDAIAAKILAAVATGPQRAKALRPSIAPEVNSSAFAKIVRRMVEVDCLRTATVDRDAYYLGTGKPAPRFMTRMEHLRIKNEIAKARKEAAESQVAELLSKEALTAAEVARRLGIKPEAARRYAIAVGRHFATPANAPEPKPHVDPIRKRRMAELASLLDQYETRRARGVIDADLADDIAWMMEHECFVNVHDRKGVRYRVIAGELIRDTNLRKPKLHKVRPPKPADDVLVRRVA